MSEMTVQQAINIVAEEAVRCRRLADDLSDPPTDDACRRRAREMLTRAEAMDRLVNIARLWNRAAQE